LFIFLRLDLVSSRYCAAPALRRDTFAFTIRIAGQKNEKIIQSNFNKRSALGDDVGQEVKTSHYCGTRPMSSELNRRFWELKPEAA
jgi:hypothetical protein